LVCLADLGELWEWETGLPIPLGGICALKSLPKELVLEMEQAIVKSLEYSLEHFDDALEFCKKYAQEMDETVLKSHIDLYVNDFTSSLGPTGARAIQVFEDAMEEMQKKDPQ